MKHTKESRQGFREIERESEGLAMYARATNLVNYVDRLDCDVLRNYGKQISTAIQAIEEEYRIEEDYESEVNWDSVQS